MSNESFSDNTSSPKKEDAVREALGVEKKYVVALYIPTIGRVETNDIHIMALNESEAREKAKELWFNGGYDAEGVEPEEANHNYDYDNDANNWEADVEEAE